MHWAIAVESGKIGCWIHTYRIISHPQINQPTKSCLLPFISQFFNIQFDCECVNFCCWAFCPFLLCVELTTHSDRLSWCDHFIVWSSWWILLILFFCSFGDLNLTRYSFSGVWCTRCGPLYTLHMYDSMRANQCRDTYIFVISFFVAAVGRCW